MLVRVTKCRLSDIGGTHLTGYVGINKMVLEGIVGKKDWLQWKIMRFIIFVGHMSSDCLSV